MMAEPVVFFILVSTVIPVLVLTLVQLASYIRRKYRHGGMK